jgi:hypothetical protein
VLRGVLGLTATLGWCGAANRAPALGACPPALNALLVLTTSNENNNLGSLLFPFAWHIDPS